MSELLKLRLNQFLCWLIMVEDSASYRRRLLVASPAYAARLRRRRWWELFHGIGSSLLFYPGMLTSIGLLAWVFATGRIT